MKVNLKKIGAIVAGATMLASSVAFAGLMYGNTQLVNDNGQPLVKVVVGEKALASDGVAAANIAAKLASEAYAMKNLTAQYVSGSVKCSAANASNGTGTCSLTNKKATLEITVPGATVTGTYTAGNLIGDYLDRALLDRGGSSSEIYYTHSSDIATDANPFTDGSSSTIGPSNTRLYKITGDMFSPLKTTTVKDEYAGVSYTETQDMWLDGNNHYSASDDDIVGTLNFLAYTLKFKGASDDLGIPV